jgi:hypothetical protein
MIYLYQCEQCNSYHDIVKHSDDHRRVERCPVCADTLTRIYTTPDLYRIKNEEPIYQPAFKKWIKNRYQLKEELKKTGAIEVGNEKPETIVKHYEKQREQKCLQRWANDD